VARRGRKRFIVSWDQDVTYLSLHPMPPPQVERVKGRRCHFARLWTRPTVQPCEMGEGKEYQNGMEWIKKYVKDWPVKQTMSIPPPPHTAADECFKDMTKAIQQMSKTQVAIVEMWPPYPVKADTLGNLTWV
jgi:hypothetical protein